MVLSIPRRVVVFDYGEVLSASQSEADKHALVELAGADAATFWDAYWEHRGDLDHGKTSIPEYWTRVAADLGLRFGPSLMQQLWAADFRSWISVEPGSIDVLVELRAGGTRAALLSNAGFDYGDAFRRAPFAQYFERVFVSAELGMLKPDPDIYRHVARELGIDPVDMVFIDNKEANVEGARSIGVTGHVFTGVEGLRAFLGSLAVPQA